ncbi:hypothetical protein LOZ53_004589 [Ophidiomyces ophidiicola]|nr:hypothetical protein LOZ55_004546 [Ophidiomyces ophidiicola]KAI1986692.1 hypothetical protein LOZ53_004589 [Ophidiomyces ophidiicola]KAI1987247.1 hypothetical protein LOZ51_005713 [Ophidiomyces ophidiicola]
MPFCTHRFSPCLNSAAILSRLPSGLRRYPFPASATRSFADSRDPTYYEVLNVPITATTQEIKKQFYALSLTHHPDKNPKDPDASSRFASISNAYQTLSNAAKRAKYDHDHDIHRAATVASSSTRSGHRGSYVGSRPPSGLSKRRGPFRGPPPSFYAHGGYGTAHHNRPPPHHHRHEHHEHQHPHSLRQPQGGPAAYDNPDAFIYHNPVPHFNAASHFRTQTHEDARRRERRLRATRQAKEEAAARGFDISDGEGNTTMRLFLVLGIMGTGWAVMVVGHGLLGNAHSSSSSTGMTTPIMYAPRKPHAQEYNMRVTSVVRQEPQVAPHGEMRLVDQSDATNKNP